MFTFAESLDVLGEDGVLRRTGDAAELNSGAVDPATDSTASHDLQMNRAVAFLLEESEEDMEGEVHIELTNMPCQKKLYFPYVGFRG